MKQYNRIADAIETLKAFPERCRVFDSQPEHDLGIRHISVGHYAAVYVIRGEDVVVLRVFYSASDITARLRENR